MKQELTPIETKLMEKADEDQILAEMRGEILDAYIYSYTKGGREIVGLSIAGINELARESAKRGEPLRVLGDPTIEDEGEFIRVIVKVGRFTIDENGRELYLDSALGAKRQWKKMALRTGEIVDDEMYFEKAISKAERNGKRKLLPASLVEKVIGEFRKQKREKSFGTIPERREPEKPTEPQKRLTTQEKRNKVYDLSKMISLTKEDLRMTLAHEYGVETITELADNQLNNLIERLEKNLQMEEPQ